MTMLVHEKEIATEAREEGMEVGKTEERAESIAVIRKKFIKGYNAAATADMLEQDISYIENIYNLFQNSPEYTNLEIAEIVLKQH